MNTLKNISRRGMYREITTRLQSSTASEVHEIRIPARIERGPTDILKALESTLHKNQGTPRYKYMDDPFLLPKFARDDATFALARESGKKTAKWVHQQHWKHFPDNLSEPAVKSFQPPVPIGKENPSSEEKLLDAISQVNLSDVLTHYSNLQGNVSNETKQSLLEFLCFTNCRPLDKMPEEIWFSLSPYDANTAWRPSPIVGELFTYLKEQDDVTAARAYNTMLCGAIRGLDGNRAISLYQECREKKILLNLTTRNHLLILLRFTSYSEHQLLEEVRKILGEMYNDGLRPNVQTLNAVLNTLTHYKKSSQLLDIMDRVLNDFEQLNVQPSLGSYYYMIKVIRKRSGHYPYVKFMQILEKIRGKRFVLQDLVDFSFFHNSMTFISEDLHDRYAGDLLHSLFLTGENYKLIGNNHGEKLYYRMYLALVLETDTLENFFKLYDTLVPYTYIPDMRLFQYILNALLNSKHDVLNYIPKVYSDLVTFGHSQHLKIAASLMQLMESQKSLPSDSPLHETFANAAINMFNKIEEETRSRMQLLEVEASLLANIIILLLRNGQTNYMKTVMNLIQARRTYLTGEMSEYQVDEIFKLLIAVESVAEILILLQYLVNSDFPRVSDMAKELHRTLPLTDVEKQKLVNLVGNKTLEDETSSKGE